MPLEIPGGGTGGGSSDGNGYAMQTVGRTIRDQDNDRRRAEEGHQRLTVKAELFYDNDWMVASTDPGWLQLEFGILTRIFDRVGLQTNVHKTIGMVCRPCRAYRVRADEDYTRWMTGE